MAESSVSGNLQRRAKSCMRPMRANAGCLGVLAGRYNAARASKASSVTDPQSEPDADSPLEVSSGRRLDSWKEIAAYLKRDVATVRRWEKREALPVQRHLHEKLGSVFVHTTELDSWSESRRQKTVAGSEESADVPVSVSIPFRQRVLPWLIAGTSALGLVVVLLYWAPWRSQGLRPPLRLMVELGAGQRPVRGGRRALTRWLAGRIYWRQRRRRAAVVPSTIGSLRCHTAFWN